MPLLLEVAFVVPAAESEAMDTDTEWSGAAPGAGIDCFSSPPAGLVASPFACLLGEGSSLPEGELGRLSSLAMVLERC